jgi:hypothetical protein
VVVVVGDISLPAISALSGICIELFIRFNGNEYSFPSITTDTS